MAVDDLTVMIVDDEKRTIVVPVLVWKNFPKAYFDDEVRQLLVGNQTMVRVEIVDWEQLLDCNQTSRV